MPYPLPEVLIIVLCSVVLEWTIYWRSSAGRDGSSTFCGGVRPSLGARRNMNFVITQSISHREGASRQSCDLQSIHQRPQVPMEGSITSCTDVDARFLMTRME